jgi:hypothetical protein
MVINSNSCCQMGQATVNTPGARKETTAVTLQNHFHRPLAHRLASRLDAPARCQQNWPRRNSVVMCLPSSERRPVKHHHRAHSRLQLWPRTFCCCCWQGAVWAVFAGGRSWQGAVHAATSPCRLLVAVPGHQQHAVTAPAALLLDHCLRQRLQQPRCRSLS